MAARPKTVSQDALDEIIRRVVEVAKPDRIIMFGSAARGDMGLHSDVDLLVVKSGRYHRGRLTERIYMNLRGVTQAVDVIVVKPSDIRRYGGSPALVIYPAMREGREVYAASETLAR